MMAIHIAIVVREQKIQRRKAIPLGIEIPSSLARFFQWITYELSRLNHIRKRSLI